MAKMHDHDQIRLLSAEVAGLEVAVNELAAALDAVDDPDARKAAVARARQVIDLTDARVTALVAVGEHRWADTSTGLKRPDGAT